MRTCFVIVAGVLAAGCSSPPRKEGSATPLDRRYAEGQVVRYRMTGVNQGRERTLRYAAEAEAVVSRDGQGRFLEEVRWTRLEFAGREVPLDDASRKFRQHLSLDARVDMAPPDIAGINPMLIGPVFDLMTFYVDLHPSLHQGRLRKAGDAAHVAHGLPNSWADGVNVTLGQDAIDFSLILSEVDDRRAVLTVQHVPPLEPRLSFPASWMRDRVNPDHSNNWVQVQRAGAGFVAAVGHETFEVRLVIDRRDGSLLSATMDNPVDVVQRASSNEKLEDPGEPVRFRIHRRIELERKP